MRQRHKIKCDKMKGKHDSICNVVSQRLSEKPYTDTVIVDEEYLLGQCDVLKFDNNREEYWEIKCNDTPTGYKKAINQLQRWSNYMYHQDKRKNYYGIYYTPTRLEIVCKNGKLRKYVR